MPTTKYVDGTNGNDSNGGNSSADAYATIAKAITASTSGTDVDNKSTIIVHSGTYVEGPLDGSSKDFISLTTAGDGLVSIKHAGASSGVANTLKVGDNWDITGNGLDLALFTKQTHGGAASTSGPAYAVHHGGSNNPFTASSIAFVGQKYLRNSMTHTQNSFGTALYRPSGSVSNCIFMHLSDIGGTHSAGLGHLNLLGNLAFMVGFTASVSTNNGIYAPGGSGAKSHCINNTFSHCTGAASFIKFDCARVLNNLFIDCEAYGTSTNQVDNYFLSNDSTLQLGNAIVNLTQVDVAGKAGHQVYGNTSGGGDSAPANQIAGSVTNMIVMPTASLLPVGLKPGDDLLVATNKCYSEDGIFPGQAYKNAIFHSLHITSSVLPHGGKSLNFAGPKRSTLIAAENISGRSIASTGPATDLLGRPWVDTANPPVGCFTQYVLYAKEPEAGEDKIARQVSLGKGNSITAFAIDEDRKSKFRNVDATTLNRATITAAGLRGRHTIYKVTTTKS